MLAKQGKSGFLRLVIILILSLSVEQPMAASEMELVSYTDYAPYVSDKLPSGGLVTAIIRASLAEEGVALKVLNMPWKRGYRLVQEGSAIGTFSWQKTPEREQEFILSDPLFADVSYIFTTLSGFREFDDIRGRYQNGKRSVICIPLGWTVPSGFKELLEEGAVERVDPEKVQSCLELMRAGRVHILNIPPLTVHYEMHRLATQLGIAEQDLIPGLTTVPHPEVGPSTTHILFARTPAGAAAAKVFASGFQKIRSNGTYRAILMQQVEFYPGMELARIERELRAAGVEFQD